MERVATVIPTFNRRDWLPGAVKSAMDKSWDNMVVIVVDDGSTDGTKDLLLEMGDGYSSHDKIFDFTIHPKNMNIARALNAGIMMATRNYGAKYIEWMSDDDRHLPHKTALQVQTFKNSSLKKLGLVYSGYDAIWIEGPPEEGFPVQRTVRAIPQYYPDRMAQWEAINRLCIINGSTTMIKAEVFKDVGYFDPNWLYAQDFEMWIRIQKSYNCFRIPQVLCNRYEHPKTLTGRLVANGINEDYEMFEYVKDWEPDTIE